MGVLSSPFGKLFATRTRTAALVVGVVAAVSVAYASIPDSSGVIHACYTRINGQLRLIDPAVSSCNPSETPLQWSQTGPQGPMGPQGPEGPQGPTGPEGPSESTVFGGFREIDPGSSDGVPNTLATVGKLLLSPGKYAIFAKINISFIENDADLDIAECRLIAESDVDRGFIVDDDDEFAAGVISLTLLHEFAGEGFAEVACGDGGDDEVVDNGDASWSNLRITAIKLGSFQNGPLLQ